MATAAPGPRMLNNGERDNWRESEPVDEKTPTSMYWPQLDQDAQVHADGFRRPNRSADARRCCSQPTAARLPSIVIAQEILLDGGYDGVAETVAMVRVRRSNALALVLIAGLGVLFAVAVGILLADSARCRCTMWQHDLPQNAPISTSLVWAQDRPRSLAHP
jgi:hypothetical protein